MNEKPEPDEATVGVQPCAWCGREPEVPTYAGLQLPNCPDPQCFEHLRTDTVKEWNDRQRLIRTELERRERAAFEAGAKSHSFSRDSVIYYTMDDYIAGRKP